MGLHNRFALNIVAYISAAIVASKLYKCLPWKRLLGTAYWFLIGNINFGFDVEVDGIKFRLSGPLRYVSSTYYLPYMRQGAHEPPVLAHISQVVKQYASPRILDVGAHYGWYTVYLAKLTAGKGTIFAFEPNEETFTRLKQNVDCNNLKNVQLYKTPLSDRREAVCMTASYLSWGERRDMLPIDKGATTKAHGEPINAISFDELNDVELIHPNIVMIDVHGVYKKVLDGMIECLKSDVEHLYIELFHPSKDLRGQSLDIKYVVSMLRDMDFIVYEIQNHLKNSRDELTNFNVNSIAMRRDRSAMLYACKTIY